MTDAAPAPVSDNGPTPAAAETPVFKVFAGNLAYSTTDDSLKAFFESAATDVVAAQVIMRGTRSAGYGFVSFANAQAAEKAIEALHLKELDGRPILVENSHPKDTAAKESAEGKTAGGKKGPKRRTGRRGTKAPPGEVTEAEAEGQEKPEGDAAAATAPKPKKKRNLRKKVKKVAEDAAAAAAGGEAPATTDASAAPNGEAATKKKAARPQRKRTPRPAGETPAGEPSKTVLFVANLGFNIDDAQLGEIFTSNGITVTSARVVKKRWGTPRKSKGYGFVDVGSEEEQAKALAALQGKEVDGRELAIKVAINAQDKEEEDEDKPAAEGATPEATVVAS